MTWAWREVIRAAADDEVVVHLNEFASHAKVQIEAQSGTPTRLPSWKALRKPRLIGASKYTITLEAIPVRFRKDINGTNRSSRTSNPLGGLEIRGAHGTRTCCLQRCPRGEPPTVAEGPRRNVPVHRGTSGFRQKAIDQAMRQLHEDAEKHLTGVTNPNF